MKCQLLLFHFSGNGFDRTTGQLTISMNALLVPLRSVPIRRLSRTSSYYTNYILVLNTDHVHH